jgi:hypothetical protein
MARRLLYWLKSVCLERVDQRKHEICERTFELFRTIPAGDLVRIAAERVGIGGTVLLSQSLHKATLFQCLDGGVVVLCTVADVGADHH